jgi:hypothetical protein
MRNEELENDRIGQKFLIPHSSFLIPHSSFLIPHSSFLIPHSSFLIKPKALLIVARGAARGGRGGRFLRLALEALLLFG